jgi:delta 1-pyrroline-5-carboxylate dehydrogenase
MAQNGTSNGTHHPALDFTTFQNTIDGKLASTKETRHGINPATGKPNAEVPVATREDVDRAMAAGLKAFKPWAKIPYAERQKKVLAWADAIAAEKDAFADMLVREQGKPMVFAQGEVDFCVHIVRTMASLDFPEETVIDEPDKKVIIRNPPLGLTVGISPWNYPLLLTCSKIAPCVVTGSPIIIKPSPFTPYCGLKVVELAQRFFPPGVVQGRRRIDGHHAIVVDSECSAQRRRQPGSLVDGSSGTCKGQLYRLERDRQESDGVLCKDPEAVHPGIVSFYLPALGQRDDR